MRVTDVGGRYRLGGVLGRGGVADVYRARDRVLDRDVAVKVLRETVDDSERSRFVAEARVLAHLSHAGLVTVLDAGTAEAQPFLVMELVEGSTLAAVLREGPLPLGQVESIGAQLASALAYAHHQDVVHRDVKPENVLLGPDGTAKLADFGIARLIGDTVRHTRTGMTVGTAAYLSPEQARGSAVGPATDVYSFGLVLVEAITGERAFPGTPMEAAMARLHRSPWIPEHIAAPWQSLLTAMTATDPDQRPTAGSVAARLGTFGAPAHGAGGSADVRTEGSPVGTKVLEVASLGFPPADGVDAERLASSQAAEAAERAADALTGSDARRWRWLAAVPQNIRGVGIAIAVLVGLLILAGVVAHGSDAPEDEMPGGTPTQLREPLQELHDAVHGREP